MKKLFIIAMAVLIASCTSAPKQETPAADTAQAFVVDTLSVDSSTVEALTKLLDTTATK